MPIDTPSGQIPLNLRPSHPFTYESFVETPSNMAALTLVRAWPKWPSPVLRLYGPIGSGKTHLGEAWALHTGGTFIDNADLMDEADLFNLINRALIGEVPGLLMASELLPRDWSIKMPDLLSRLLAAPEVELTEPDEASLESILRALFLQQGREVSRDVVIYILAHVDRSIDALRALVKTLDELAAVEKKDITKAFTAKYIKTNLELDL
ncbi:hypothetical protein ACJ3XI_02670 [Litorimonas sp. RW-G-Af-16]|uniref:hypothetical protein n=1 Tax=Litorimonas sp. RW-G-Af-16 TaxID=3241168 RepID=UPI00390CA1F8